MDVFTALSDPTRRSILEMLARSGPLTATEIYDCFQASHPAISQHLKALREAGLVLVEKKAQQRIYRLNPEPMHKLEIWVRALEADMEERFERLDRVLEAEQAKPENSNQVAPMGTSDSADDTKEVSSHE